MIHLRFLKEVCQNSFFQTLCGFKAELPSEWAQNCFKFACNGVVHVIDVAVDGGHCLEYIAAGGARLDGYILVDIVSTIYLDVLTCRNWIDDCLINFFVRCLHQDLRFASWVDKRFDIHSILCLEHPCSNHIIECSLDLLLGVSGWVGSVFASPSNQCSSDDEMVSALASFAPSFFLRVLIVSVKFASPFLRTSSSLRAMEAIFSREENSKSLFEGYSVGGVAHHCDRLTVNWLFDDKIWGTTSNLAGKPMGFACRGVWVMGYYGRMGYGM